jgi:hypothetical protein
MDEMPTVIQIMFSKFLSFFKPNSLEVIGDRLTQIDPDNNPCIKAKIRTLA